MAHTFNNLPEAQAFARANNVKKYWRMHMDDTETREMRGRGGWWHERPHQRFYMDHTDLIRDLTTRVTSADRTTVETLWTDTVSDSPLAR